MEAYPRDPAKAAEPDDQLPPPPEGKTWKLVWHDEFDGTKLDESKCYIPEGKRRDGWWSPKAVSLDGDGNLAISTLKDGDKYLDACVRTRGKFEHAHGYYVARIKLQEEPGHWSAFWLYNSSVGKVGNDGRDGTEIDIMENVGWEPTVSHGAVHGPGYTGAGCVGGLYYLETPVADDYHVFASTKLPVPAPANPEWVNEAFDGHNEFYEGDGINEVFEKNFDIPEFTLAVKE